MELFPTMEKKTMSYIEAGHVLAAFMERGENHPLFEDACRLCRTTPLAVKAARKSVRGMNRSLKGVILTPTGGRRRS